MDHKEALIYTSHQSWQCWRTRRLFRQSGCNFGVFDTSDEAELRAWLAHYFAEEGDRR